MSHAKTSTLRARTSLLVVAMLVATSCAPPTSLEVGVTFAPALGIDQLELTLLRDGEALFDPVLAPEEPRALTSGEESVALLLPDDLAGETVTVVVRGLLDGAELASGSADVVIALGQVVPVSVHIEGNDAGECGDGVVDAGEDCDDGDANSDTAPGACRTSCVPAFCGDGVIDPSETCDDGAQNSDTVSGACRRNCAPAFCGDGVIDPIEACDDGVLNSDTVSGACRTNCAPAFCGDDVVDQGETCDDGTQNSDTVSGACRLNCTPAFCGDGVIDPSETCDDGAQNSDTVADACRLNCTPAFCGDGVIDLGETCDDGAQNSDTVSGACRTTCVPAVCGDGVLDPGESCDEGDENGDEPPALCRTDCVLASCGDGLLDVGEECDDGTQNSDTEPGACRENCVLAHCSDGVVDPTEECDDGGLLDGDGCDGVCVVELGWLCAGSPSVCGTDCGDGILAGDEECDDGGLNSDTAPDACRTTCLLPACGDGVIDLAEACDDGDANSDTAPDACRTTCVLPICGDGVIDLGEACDDGDANSDTDASACRTNCVEARCGDGIIDDDEECDDGDLGNNDIDPGACRTTCALPRCGDGIVDVGEECDDAATDNSGACLISCHVATCGDGFIQEGIETCDDGNAVALDGCSVCSVDIGYACWGAPSTCVTLARVRSVHATDGPFVTIQAAINAASNDDAIFIAPATYNEALSVIGKRVTLVGVPGVIVETAAAAPTLTVDRQGNTQGLARVRGMTLSHLGQTQPVVRVQVQANNTLDLVGSIIGPSAGVGIESINNNTTVIARRSLIHGNTGGGLSIAGASTIESTAIVDNGLAGAAGSAIGGVRLALASTFRFNTVTNNRAITGTTAGIICQTASTSIVGTLLWGNEAGDVTTPNCVVTSSNAEQALGGTNTSIDPRLLEDGYHLHHRSLLRDSVDAAVCPVLDVDAERRPMGAQCEIGADELP